MYLLLKVILDVFKVSKNMFVCIEIINWIRFFIKYWISSVKYDLVIYDDDDIKVKCGNVNYL